MAILEDCHAGRCSEQARYELADGTRLCADCYDELADDPALDVYEGP